MPEQRGTPPRFTKACVAIGLLTVAVFAYGAWMVKVSHEHTGEISNKIKERQVPSSSSSHNGDTLKSNNQTFLNNKAELSKHTQMVLIYAEEWMNLERRGKHLVLSDSICRKMTPPTDQTDVKSYPGVRVEEMTDLLDHFPAIVAGYSTIIIHIGTNNLYARDSRTEKPQLDMFPVQEIHRLYERLCDKIRKINPDSVIYASAILPRQGDPEITYDKLTEVNSLLEADFGNRFIQSGHGFADADVLNANGKRELGFKKEFFKEDGLHLTSEGQEFLAKKFQQVLTEV